MSQDTTQRRSRRLLDQVRDRARVLHYSYCTERAYVDWIRRYAEGHA